MILYMRLTGDASFEIRTMGRILPGNSGPVSNPIPVPFLALNGYPSNKTKQLV